MKKILIVLVVTNLVMLVMSASIFGKYTDLLYKIYKYVETLKVPSYIFTGIL